MFFLILFALIVGSGSTPPAVKFEPIDESKRDEYISRAQVWHPTEIGKMDLYLGPQRNGIMISPNQEITCHYIEWKGEPSGTQPKFNCKLQNGEEVRIKYGRDTLEIYSEVLATRLFWALGFYADEDQPVRLRCVGCPEKNPFKPEPGERRITAIIRDAMLERNFPGQIIEVKEDQGWTWKELEKVDPNQGGATRAQIDAFKLLAVLIQHGDQKPAQQRLACLRNDIVDPDHNGLASCRLPIMMIQDLGATFGRADLDTSDDAKMHFDKWKNTSIWNSIKEAELLVRSKHHLCVGTLTNSISAKDGLQDPVISEEGRKFLAGLLSQLSEKQIRDLFTVARVEHVNDSQGQKRVGTVDDWIAAFLEKRKEILDRTCPEIK